ncbi:MAG TPA: hypothetical protein VFU31_24605 [Candidatus Binatia bacterium]|nr:hypothetical protein [Candidatus Binatia bacterium]
MSESMWMVLGAQLLKPLALLVLAAVVFTPVRWAVIRFLRDGKLKRFLMWRGLGRYDGVPAFFIVMALFLAFVAFLSS